MIYDNCEESEETIGAKAGALRYARCKMAVHISEMCYIFRKYGKMPSDSIRSFLVSFYDGAEILVLKSW